jgi:hypothetical protein
MDRTEATELLRDHLRSWRSRSYQELADQVGESHQSMLKGDSGTDYQVEVQLVWDSETHGNLRVIASIDDGGWRAFVPVTDTFLLAPDGSFVGE